MSFDEIREIYYGPASQEFIKKYKLGCPNKPMWVDYERLKAVLFAKKTSSGKIAMKVDSDGNTVVNFRDKDQRPLHLFVQKVNEQCFLIIDGVKYISFIDAINAIYTLNSTPEVIEMSQLTVRNMRAADLMNAKDRVLGKIQAMNSFNVPKNISAVLERETAIGNVIRPLLEEPINKLSQLQTQLTDVVTPIREELERLKSYVSTADSVVDMYRVCIKNMTEGRYLQYAITAFKFAKFLEIYDVHATMSKELSALCFEMFLDDSGKTITTARTLYIYSEECDEGIERLLSSTNYSIKQSVIEKMDPRITDMIDKDGIEWNNGKRNTLVIIRLTETTFMSDKKYADIIKDDMIFDQYAKNKELFTQL